MVCIRFCELHVSPLIILIISAHFTTDCGLMKFWTKLCGQFKFTSSFSSGQATWSATFSPCRPAGRPPKPDPHLQTTAKRPHQAPLSATRMTGCSLRLQAETNLIFPALPLFLPHTSIFIWMNCVFNVSFATVAPKVQPASSLYIHSPVSPTLLQQSTQSLQLFL